VSCSYGFVVYSDPNVTDVACAGLNGLKMGDRTLTVRRAAEVSIARTSCLSKGGAAAAVSCSGELADLAMPLCIVVLMMLICTLGC
jgi:splicing factor U2AF subunit